MVEGGSHYIMMENSSVSGWISSGSGISTMTVNIGSYGFSEKTWIIEETPRIVYRDRKEPRIIYRDRVVKEKVIKTEYIYVSGVTAYEIKEVEVMPELSVFNIVIFVVGVLIVIRYVDKVVNWKNAIRLVCKLLWWPVQKTFKIFIARWKEVQAEKPEETDPT